MDALIQGDTELAAFYEQRVRAELVPTFDAWMATNPLEHPDAPASPFAMPQYAPVELARADELDAEAGQVFTDG